MFRRPRDRLLLTENTQPAILAVERRRARLAASRGIRAAFAAGHSLGEYSAHVAAGTLSFADALRTVRQRGQFMQEAVPVGEGRWPPSSGWTKPLSPAPARQRGLSCRPGRGAGQSERPRSDRDCRSCRCRRPRRGTRESGGANRVMALAVSAPFHCALMKPAEDRLEPLLRRCGARSRHPRRRQRRRRTEERPLPPIDALVRQVSSPVRWEDVVQRLIAEGVRTFVELGPGNVLAD